MPTATNNLDGVRIHYETHGDGPALMLHHGGGGSLDRWHELGYVRALSRQFQLVLIDARGHGKSDHPYTAEAYRYERWVTDLVAVLDHAGIEQAHFFGYSLGGLVEFRIPRYASDRFSSLILGGAHPYAQFEFYNRQYEAFRDGLEGYLRRQEAQSKPVNQAERARLEQVDLEVYALAGKALRDEPSAMDTLERTSIPMLLFAGEDDATDELNKKLPQAADRIPGAVVLMISGHGHDVLRQTDLVVPCLLSYLYGLDQQIARRLQ